MILDNLSRALKTQNWFAAGIEFVIVIAGVVIGFQINAWAEARSDAERAEALRVRLEQDFTLILNQVSEARGRLEGHADAAVRVRNTLREGAIPVDEDAFTAQLFQALSTHPAVGGSPTFAEMQATGDLALIRDDDLRAALVVFEQHARQTGEVAGFLLPAFLEAVALIDPHADYALGEEGQAGVEIAQYDYEALTGQAHVFQNLARINQNMEDLFSRQHALAERVLVALETADDCD